MWVVGPTVPFAFAWATVRPEKVTRTLEAERDARRKARDGARARFDGGALGPLTRLPKLGLPATPGQAREPRARTGSGGRDGSTWARPRPLRAGPGPRPVSPGRLPESRETR